MDILHRIDNVVQSFWHEYGTRPTDLYVNGYMRAEILGRVLHDPFIPTAKLDASADFEFMGMWIRRQRSDDTESPRIVAIARNKEYFLRPRKGGRPLPVPPLKAEMVTHKGLSATGVEAFEDVVIADPLPEFCASIVGALRLPTMPDVVILTDYAGRGYGLTFDHPRARWTCRGNSRRL